MKQAAKSSIILDKNCTGVRFRFKFNHYIGHVKTSTSEIFQGEPFEKCFFKQMSSSYRR